MMNSIELSMKKVNFAIFFTILPLILLGCGLKGPLYKKVDPITKVNLKKESKTSNIIKEGSGGKKIANGSDVDNSKDSKK